MNKQDAPKPETQDKGALKHVETKPAEHEMFEIVREKQPNQVMNEG